MPPYPVDEYDVVKFRRSQTKNKKYDALIQHKTTDKKFVIPFGDNRYSHYNDSTGLGLYSELNHNDKVRRALYRARHSVFYDSKFYSPAYFSWKYLW